ncbi:MAG: iron ABC transporter permease, partial [Spirochaetia bacterium]
MEYKPARTWERPHAVFLAVLLFLLLFFYIPVGHVFLRAFVRDGVFAPTIFFETLLSPYTARLVGFTFFQAALSTIFSLLLGLPGAYIITKYRFPGRSLVRSASAVPFVLPPILVVLGFVIFFGNNGFLNRALMSLFDLTSPPLKILYSLKAIILAHGFYNFPIALRVVSSLWQSLPPTQEWAASTLGAKGGRLFRTITLPQLLPSIYAAAALIFMFCFTSFAVVLVLGGGPELTTVEVEIYRLARISFDLHTAAALSIIALLFTLGIMFIYVRLQSSSSYYQAVSRKTDYSREVLRRPGKAAGGAMILYTAGTLLVIAGPLIAIIVNSFRKPMGWSGDTVFTLQWYKQILGIGEGISGGRFSQIALEAVTNSAAIGILATVVAVPVGIALSYYTVRYSRRSQKIIDTLTMAPMTTSSVVLGLGYLLISRTLS